MDHQIIGSPVELDDRDLDVVAGGGGEYGCGCDGTTQVGLVNVNDVNVLSGIGILGIGIAA
jgi:hypothetical protein